MGKPSPGVSLWPLYQVIELRRMAEVRQIFGENGEDVNHLNWCFVATAGNHGTTTTLDEVEAILQGTSPDMGKAKGGKWWVTILIVHPRLVVMKYGEIEVTKDDIDYLRILVRKTLEEIPKTQEGNL